MIGHFDTILVANRGEIACRIFRAARGLGLRTVAVYSEADRNALHVRAADVSVLIGGAAASESYLDMDAILKAAKQSGAGAIHPGYGFLSENADFARAVTKAGLVFIGPPADAIEIMGDKARAKVRMLAADVPCIPGYQGSDQSLERLTAEAAKIGVPIMVKAAAGGGGRGMRRVDNLDDLPPAINAARIEAKAAFGADHLILERAISAARHVEIQVFADSHGKVVHLGERDCSVQRRHQKIIEEAPCPAVTSALRDAMGQAAVRAVRDVSYIGAGTVEFLLDGAGDFFFLEMNTRLQVEHPVTEMVSGLDLVDWQIRVARGEKLPCEPSEISLQGHAIEARLYAEDPDQDFFPQTGTLTHFEPSAPIGVRWDTGVARGSEVSPFYDPMLAKIIAHGPTRDVARQRLIAALSDSLIFGVRTNRAFLIDVLRHADFAKGTVTTDFLTRNFADRAMQTPTARDKILAAILLYSHAQKQALTRAGGMPCALLGWSNARDIFTPYDFDGTSIQIRGHDVTLSQAKHPYRIIDITAPRAKIQICAEIFDVHFDIPAPAKITLCRDGATHAFTNALAQYSAEESIAMQGLITAPMHGAVIDIFVSVGQSVTLGQCLGRVEAMKMQHEISAGVAGIISKVHTEIGAQIAAGAPIFEIEDSP